MLIVAWLLILVFSSVSVKAARDGDLRLVDSNRYGTGRVEVFYEGRWGTICGRGWDLTDAEVICRQLNFPNGALRSFYEAKFGEGGGKVLLSDVSCNGDENNILECGNVQNNWGINDCQHDLDVGVQCSAPNYQGCFEINFLRAVEGFQSEEMTIETCFELCVPGGYRYFWMHGGGSCDCGDNIGTATQVGNERCATDCPGNSDQRCGGRDVASLYQEGSHCDTVTTVSNGRLSTAPVPYTVGTQITVTCFPGYIPYDETVFCQTDGNFNRDIMCVPGPSTTARSAQQLPRSTQVSSATPQSTPEPTQPPSPLTTQQVQPSPTNSNTARNCTVPIIENGEHDSDTDTLSPGDDLMVTCSFPYKANESIITCQRDGTFTASADCSLDVIIIVVLAVVSVVFVVTFVMVIGCMISNKKKRRHLNLKGSLRQERVTTSGSVSLQLKNTLHYETTQTVSLPSYDRHIIDTAKLTTADGYERHIIDESNPRDDSIGCYNQESTKLASVYYNIKSDPNSQNAMNYGLKLNQNYPYEDVLI